MKKTLSRIKLNQLNKDEKLQKNEMMLLKGGGNIGSYGYSSCTCPNTAYNRDNGGDNTKS